MEFVRLEEQPKSIDFDIKFGEGDRIFIKQTFLEKAGSYYPQHSHEYEHVTFIPVGSVRAWCDDELIGDIHGPNYLTIGAHKKHLFMTLVDNTIIECIHNTSRTGEVEIHEEHQIT